MTDFLTVAHSYILIDGIVQNVSMPEFSLFLCNLCISSLVPLKLCGLAMHNTLLISSSNNTQGMTIFNAVSVIFLSCKQKCCSIRRPQQPSHDTSFVSSLPCLNL